MVTYQGDSVLRRVYSACQPFVTSDLQGSFVEFDFDQTLIQDRVHKGLSFLYMRNTMIAVS
jgi:hypothetical protein